MTEATTWNKWDGDDKTTRIDRETDGYLLAGALSLRDQPSRPAPLHLSSGQSSESCLGLTAGKTLSEYIVPDFLYQAVARSLNDMAEGTLGRLSLFGLLRRPYEDVGPRC